MEILGLVRRAADFASSFSRLLASIAVSRVSTDQHYCKVTIRASNDRKLWDTGTDESVKTFFGEIYSRRENGMLPGPAKFR
jgi:hypothetical protein